MADKITICNLALSLLGEESITQFNEETQSAEVCRLVYDAVLESLLCEYPWSFSLRRVVLDTIVLPAPAYGYSNRFALPEDCLCVIQIGTEFDYPRDLFQIEGRYILIDDSSVSIIYISKDINIQHATPAFVQAFSASLAVEMATRIEGTRNVLQNMVSLYQDRLATARRTEAQMSSYIQDNSGWLSQRYTGAPAYSWLNGIVQ